MRKIVVYPAKILREVTLENEEVDSGFIKDIIELKKVLEISENGAGLAATQIGLNRRFFGLKETKTKKVEIFINPKIEAVFGERVYPLIKVEGEKDEDFLEGCLSFPDYYGTVRRFLKISVSWQELTEGQLIKKNRDLTGFEAIVFQHEFDHLNGVMFVDRIFEEKGKCFKSIKKEMVPWDLGLVIGGKL